MDDIIQKFANEKGYKSASYLGVWNGFKCYEPILDTEGVLFIGLPLMILEDNAGNIRMSTTEEAMEQLRDGVE